MFLHASPCVHVCVKANLFQDLPSLPLASRVCESFWIQSSSPRLADIIFHICHTKVGIVGFDYYLLCKWSLLSIKPYSRCFLFGRSTCCFGQFLLSETQWNSFFCLFSTLFASCNPLLPRSSKRRLHAPEPAAVGGCGRGEALGQGAWHCQDLWWSLDVEIFRHYPI